MVFHNKLMYFPVYVRIVETCPYLQATRCKYIVGDVHLN